jgi:hypothetical protein
VIPNRIGLSVHDRGIPGDAKQAYVIEENIGKNSHVSLAFPMLQMSKRCLSYMLQLSYLFVQDAFAYLHPRR